MSGYGKASHNFGHSSSNLIKVTFLDSSHQNLLIGVYILFGSTEVCIFPLFSIVFANDFIMTSFIGTWFSNLHILSNFECPWEAYVKILTGVLVLFFWVGKFFSYFSGFRKISAIFLGLTNFQLYFWVFQFLYCTLETFE